MKFFLVMAGLLAAPSFAFADDAQFVSGRPGKTESAIVAPTGRLQIETEIANVGVDKQDGVRTQSLLLASTSFRYGVARKTELELIVEPYSRTRTSDASGKDTVDGFGDTALRVRRNLIGQDGGAKSLGVIGYVTLPTSTNHTGSKKVGGGILIPAGLQLSDKLSVSVTGGLAAIDSGTPGDYAALWSAGATLSYALNDKWGVFGEAYAERSSDNGAKTDATLDFGITYLAAAHLQLDTGLNVGVTNAASDLEAFIGAALLF